MNIECGGRAVAAPAILGRRAFDAVPERVGDARRWLRRLLGDGCDDALECLSEVFTNAVLHSASGAAQTPVSVAVLEAPPGVRVEVTDAGANTEPRLLSPDATTAYGRGLLLLDALTGGRWGWEDRSSGRTVWFEVPRC